jgi:hypothetical protein
MQVDRWLIKESYMRRSILSGFGVAAIFIIAACTDSPRQPSPLAPNEPTLAVGDQCSGPLASQIGKDLKALFSGAAYNDLSSQFAAIKNQCPNVFPQMMTFLDAMIGYSGAPTNANRAGRLVDFLASVTLYVTGTAEVRPSSIFMNSGGVMVLSPGEVGTTWDNRLRLEVPANTTPAGDHLYSFSPEPSTFCGDVTTLQVRGNCYDAKDYPQETLYNPSLIVTLCLRSAFGPRGILHDRADFGGEILPPPAAPPTFSCANVHTMMNSWLGTDAGPVGRVLAKAYDYLRPKPLFADDAGESGSLGLFGSPLGGVLTVVYDDGFTANQVGPLANGTDPVVGDTASSWLVESSFPGYVQIQNGFGSLTGNVVVISQALGNCSQCPTVKLVGTRVNPSATDNIGSYEISWDALQNKPSVKEGPFVVLDFTGAEIARLSYVTEMGTNRLKYNGVNVGTWATDVHQNFKITVNLNTLNDQNEYTTSLSIGGSPVATNVPFVTPSATTVSTFGYVLTGIDAGIIAADNFLMKRLPDIP